MSDVHLRGEDFSQDIAAIGSIEAIPSMLRLICRTTGMGFAAVARVTEDRWIACEVQDNIGFGLKSGGELKVDTTLCHEVRQGHDPIIIDHVASDPIYAQHHTPAIYGLQSYISVPIRLRDGTFFGTLCAIDPEPHRLNTADVREMFAMFADVIGFHLSVIDRLRATEHDLMDERKVSALREQFIAVLGHDLRNPLAAIDSGMRLLRRTELNDRASGIVTMVQGSVKRMAGLIDNVMDFARGRLGGGLALERKPVELATILQQVVDELRIRLPEEVITVRFDINAPVCCDAQRVGQLASNLLGNAITYGSADRPILIEAATTMRMFELSVTNAGEAIPPEVMERIFRPFSRGAVRPSMQGLGLGLYISHEIATAHGGTLDVRSTSDETRFTFRMPIS